VGVDLRAAVADLVLEHPVVAAALALPFAGSAGCVARLAGHAVRALDAVPTTAGNVLQADAVTVVAGKNILNKC
jgi:hypothetical protein